MTIKELKNSLAKLGRDDDLSRVVFMVIDIDGNYEYHLCAFTGYPTSEKIKNCFILGSEEAAYKMISEGTLNKEDFGPKNNLDKLFPPEDED